MTDAVNDEALNRLNARFAAIAGISQERQNQITKWGEQSHPDGTGPDLPPVFPIYWGDSLSTIADRARYECDMHADADEVTWLDILLEEVFEAAAEEDKAKLRKELIQVAAVCAAWVEDLDTRT